MGKTRIRERIPTAIICAGLDRDGFGIAIVFPINRALGIGKTQIGSIAALIQIAGHGHQNNNRQNNRTRSQQQILKGPLRFEKHLQEQRKHY